jgi:ankyrin repeat protein
MTSFQKEKYLIIKDNRDYIISLLTTQSYDELSKLFILGDEPLDPILNISSMLKIVFTIDHIQYINDTSYNDNYLRGRDIRISVVDLINTKLFSYCICNSDGDLLKELLIVDSREDMLWNLGEDTISDIVEDEKIFKIILAHMDLKQKTIGKFFKHAINMQSDKVVITLLDMGIRPTIKSIKDIIEEDSNEILEILLEYNCDNIQTGFDSCVFYDTYMNEPVGKMYNEHRIETTIDTIKILTKYNINISEKLNDILFYACQNNQLYPHDISQFNLVTFCLEYGECNIDTALKISCLNNNFETMTYLLELGAVINVIDEKDLLHTDIKMIKFLLQHEYIFTKQVLFEIFYILLFSSHSIEIINYMTSIGADFDQLFYIEEYLPYHPDRKSWLTHIIRRVRIDIMTYLVNTYYDKLDIDKLIITSITNGNICMVNYLLTVKPEFDICATKIFTLACYYGHLSSVKYLLDMGVDINSVDENLFNTIACKKDIKNDYHYNGLSGPGCVDILKFLFDYNIPIPKNNIFGSYDDKILDVDIIRYLVTHGFDINADISPPMEMSLTGNHGQTIQIKIINLLDLSVRQHKRDVITFLLENGMDPTVNDNNAIKISIDFDAKDITKMLTGYMPKKVDF